MDNETARRLAKLDALEAGGVDNWEFYDESLKEWHKDNHVFECVKHTIEEINELLVDADVDQPAGPGCGFSINFDQAKMSLILHKLIRESQEA